MNRLLASVAILGCLILPANAQSVKNSDTLGQAQYNFPAGFIRTTDEPHQVFYDPFDSTIDTTNRWTITTGNSAVAASNTTGVMSMGTGTAASGWSKLVSQPTFIPTIPAWLGFSFAINLPDGGSGFTSNAYRFWGAGNPASTPTTAAPMTDAVGFEITTSGHLAAVVYAGGTRTQIADLFGTTQPQDTSSHRYIVYVRTDKTYWYIDNLATPVASSNFQSPQVQTLPMALVAVGGATAPTVNAQIQSAGLAVWDTGKNAVQIADGTFPWRKLTVSPSGTFSASADPCASQAKSSAVINITSATTTALVPVSGATSVYVCGISMTINEVLTTPNTILFEQGTGTACTGSPTALTGKFGDGGITAGIPIVVNAGAGSTVFKTAAANGLCALTAIGAAASFQGVVTYVQQ